MRRRKHGMAGLVSVLLLALALTSCGSSSQQHSTSAQPVPVSGQLVGVTFDGPVFAPTVNLVRQVNQAVASGAESLRVSVDWSRVQPYRTMSKVPSIARSQFVSVGGVPTTFAELDRLVAAAAARRLSLLPVVEFTPNWDAVHPGDPASPPRSTAAFAAFLTGLVKRYGPTGTFWSAHPALPRVPIRMWQIWNEPHFTTYWSQQPFAPSYVKLLAAAHTALKSADPGAKVVLAGLADFSWKYLADIYRVPGARRLFDIVAVHPYTAQPRGVITILQRVRAVMDRSGDSAKPILATEITWPSSEGKAPPEFGVSTTERQQALRLAQVMPMLAAKRSQLGLMGFYWYTWMGNESPTKKPYAFDYAGLLKYVNGVVSSKPALAAFTHGALTIEGCTGKSTAQTCSK
jgi:hypothetical protein